MAAVNVSSVITQINNGQINGLALMELAKSVNIRLFREAGVNHHTGYGEEVAGKFKNMSWADLNIINERATLEVFNRTMDKVLSPKCNAQILAFTPKNQVHK